MLTDKQRAIKYLIEEIAKLLNMDVSWPVAIAMTESSLGLNQRSPTGARGVFQMTSIAMKDLLQEMEKKDDDVIDILCGISFLHLLRKRWGSIDEATQKYCDPKDRDFYLDKVKKYMKELYEVPK